MKNIVIDECINHGGSSKVYNGYDLDNKLYAIKVIDKHKIKTTLLNLISNEYEILENLDHPNIIKLYGHDIDDRYIRTYMDLYEGDLLDYTNTKHVLSENETYIIFKQLISAISYLHIDNYIVHRDIKLDNILYNMIDGQIHIVLADFGFAVHRLPTDPLLTDYPGTVEYSAIELLTKTPYQGYPADIYALGVCIFSMLAGKYPTKYDNVRMIINNEDLAELLIQMFTPIECDRININQIASTKYILSKEH